MNSVFRTVVFSAAFVLLAVYGYFTLRGPQGIPALMEKRREIRQLEEENANLAREIEFKRERIRKLQESPSEQDLEIRKKLKMLHQNETEFVLPNSPKTDGPKTDDPKAEAPASDTSGQN